MKERIKLVMENEGLTPAKFADRLGINRAVISHILNGRNNPSLDVVTKILSEMDYINPDWLLGGKGEMYKQGVARGSVAGGNLDLFSQSSVNEERETEKTENARETEVKHVPEVPKTVENKPIELPKIADRKVSQIIVYYSDSTFEVFKGA
jgi:transcriptional regulator with XRE-family HTH domain